MRYGALILCLWGWPMLVAAQTVWHSVPSEPPPTGRSRFWMALGDPAAHRAEALREQAEGLMHLARRLLPASWESLCQRTHATASLTEIPEQRRARAHSLRQWLRPALRRQALVESARLRLERAAMLQPHDARVLHSLARAHLAWEQPASIWHCKTYRRDPEARLQLERLRALHPDHEPDRVAAQLGHIHTRRHAFSDAAREFAQALALALDRDQHALLQYNLAEVIMLQGRPVPAARHYERALSTARELHTQALALWGLAVARDRAGDHDAALEVAMRALRAPGSDIQVLRSDGVFFEPAHEIHYYEGIGHEARARLDEARALEHHAAALAAWQRYLTLAPATDRWISAARAHADRLADSQPVTAPSGPDPHR